MRNRCAALIFTLLVLPLASGCPTERAPRAKEPVMPEDAWSSLATSKEWLLSTSDFSGDRAAECAHVLGWIKGEESCRASLCAHGRDLAEEWLARCPALVEASAVAEVKDLQAKFTERAAQKVTACGAQLEAIFRKGCGPDGACVATGQAWAARCAVREGSPLAVLLLERMIERKLPESAQVKLDTRSCEDLGIQVLESARCKDRLTCAEALSQVEAYRARCEREEARPTLAIAVAELAVLVGADRTVAPILLRKDSAPLGPDDVPVALSDSSGGVLRVCEQQASDFNRYLEARKGCQAGRMVVARAFNGARGIEVRTGSLDFPDDATFLARYPTIVAAGEIEARDREAAVRFEAELQRVVDFARTPAGATEAMRALLRAVNAHALALKRSATLRQALSSRDAALAPALVEIGKAKAAATRGQVSGLDVAGLIGRAPGRAFADMAEDGKVQIGVASRAGRLDTAAMLPKATAAYRQALRGARLRKISDDMVQVAKAEGVGAAASCGKAEKRLQEAKLSLINCSFEVERCDEEKRDALIRSADEARGATETAYHALDRARTGAGAAEAWAIGRAAETAGCREPWW